MFRSDQRSLLQNDARLLQQLRFSSLCPLRLLLGDEHEETARLPDRERMGVGRNWTGVADLEWDYFAPSIMDNLCDGDDPLLRHDDERE